MKRMVLLTLVFQMFFSLSLSAQQSEVYMNSADFKHGLELLTNPDAPDEDGAIESLQKEVRNFGDKQTDIRYHAMGVNTGMERLVKMMKIGTLSSMLVNQN